MKCCRQTGSPRTQKFTYHAQETKCKIYNVGEYAKKQEWRAGKEQPGVFRFCFWLLGSWIKVLLDDQLLVVEGTLYSCRSLAASEFWALLLEKASAKFPGCCELLEACSLSDALVDKTGAPAEHLELAVGGYARDPALQEQLFSKTLTVLDDSCQTVVYCAISVEDADEMNSTTSNVLLRGHAYLVYLLDVVEDGTVAVLAYLLQDSLSSESPTGHFAIGMHIMQMDVNGQFRVPVIKAKVCSLEYVRARGVIPAKGNDAVGQMEASNYGQKRENCHSDFPAVRVKMKFGSRGKDGLRPHQTTSSSSSTYLAHTTARLIP
ncbi:hypothetical protein HPB51_027635 [Rhipicephalus microplus]|uniref:Calpain catalytic domain-containing protein n=1 Tax=Rhipicephalus microplus TaxID=6941 RepID=A0A9J6CZF9_RHIMP|nr:hypothetical protein HPB51_027635 [Rhipicephalus microplus]